MLEECERRVCSPSHRLIQHKGLLLLGQEHRGLGVDGIALDIALSGGYPT